MTTTQRPGGLDGDLEVLAPGAPGVEAAHVAHTHHSRRSEPMTDAHDVERLEQRIHELEAQQEALQRQLQKAQLEQWEGRIDDLEVQIHLGALELGDRLDPLLEALRNRWLDAKQSLNDSASSTGDVLDALRNGLDQAMHDVRTAILDAKDAAAR
jgi:hypothetical protein